jgi:predicted HTH transcriptional regulator
VNQKELSELIRNGESEKLDFKENFDREAIETAVAFANTKGGIILIGISDIRKDIYTEEYLRGLGLNERQIKAVLYVKEKGKITSKEYQELNRVSKPMATIELRDIVEKKIFEKSGTTGKGTEYTLLKKRANNGLIRALR